MRILLIHNYHRGRGGADQVFEATTAVLAAAGHDVHSFTRDSRSISGTSGRWQAFAQSLLSRGTLSEFTTQLRAWQPDVVHAHELYPLITPRIFPICRDIGIPCVLTCHDYRLTCPTRNHFRAGELCTACFEPGLQSCVRYNCRGNFLESCAYACQNAQARYHDWFGSVSLFLAPSEFTRQWLIHWARIKPERIQVLGNPVSAPRAYRIYQPAERPYIGYLGRLAPEKGVAVLFDAAGQNGLPVRVAGGTHGCKLPPPPANVTAVGELSDVALESFWAGCRILVAPSLALETFGLTCAEALTRGIPVIATHHGALAELIRSEVNGLLVPPGDSAALAAAMQRLWDDPDYCLLLSRNVRSSSAGHSLDAYCADLLAAYSRAMES